MKKNLYKVNIIDIDNIFFCEILADNKIDAIEIVRERYKRNNDKRCLCTMSAILICDYSKEDFFDGLG